MHGVPRCRAMFVVAFIVEAEKQNIVCTDYLQPDVSSTYNLVHDLPIRIARSTYYLYEVMRELGLHDLPIAKDYGDGELHLMPIKSCKCKEIMVFRRFVPGKASSTRFCTVHL